MGTNLKYSLLFLLLLISNSFATIPFRVYPLSGNFSLNWSLDIVVSDINRPFVYLISGDIPTGWK